MPNTYGIIAEFSREGGKPQQLRYEMTIQSGRLKGGSRVVHKIHKYNVHINDRSPESVSEELAVACGNSIYPAIVRLNSQREIAVVLNHEPIRQRWQDRKKQLQTTYTGDTARWYIEKTNRSVAGASSVLAALRQELFLKFYFLPVHLNYGAGMSPPSRIDIPIIPYTRPVRYAIANYQTDIDPAENSYHATLEGWIDDQRSAQDLAAGLRVPSGRGGGRPAEGTLKITYRNAMPSGTRKAITAAIGIEGPDGQSRNIHLEAYTIPNKNQSS